MGFRGTQRWDRHEMLLEVWPVRARRRAARVREHRRGLRRARPRHRLLRQRVAPAPDAACRRACGHLRRLVPNGTDFRTEEWEQPGSISRRHAPFRGTVRLFVSDIEFDDTKGVVPDRAGNYSAVIVPRRRYEPAAESVARSVSPPVDESLWARAMEHVPGRQRRCLHVGRAVSTDHRWTFQPSNDSARAAGNHALLSFVTLAFHFDCELLLPSKRPHNC